MLHEIFKGMDNAAEQINENFELLEDGISEDISDTFELMKVENVVAKRIGNTVLISVATDSTIQDGRNNIANIGLELPVPQALSTSPFSTSDRNKTVSCSVSVSGEISLLASDTFTQGVRISGVLFL